MNSIDLRDLEEISNVILAGVTDRVKKWDGLITETTQAQQECEEKCAHYLIPENRLTPTQIQKKYKDGFFNVDGETTLNVDMHCDYLNRHCGKLSTKYMYSYSSYNLFFILN